MGAEEAGDGAGGQHAKPASAADAVTYSGIAFRLFPGCEGAKEGAKEGAEEKAEEGATGAPAGGLARPCTLCRPPSLHVRLAAAIVPSASAASGARLSFGHVTVLDDFLSPETRSALAEAVLSPRGAAALSRWATTVGECSGLESAARERVLCPARWERGTADRAGGHPTWGLRSAVLDSLEHGTWQSHMREVGRSLRTLFPEHQVCLMPGAAMRPEEGAEEDASVCRSVVGNAASAGDEYGWHVDADPSSLHDASPWVRAMGDYVNGEPDRPVLLSLLVYLNPEWDPTWSAETRVLDPDSGAGLLVLPRPGRALLMDQDVVHALSSPSAAAGGRPRLSLVWKLALLPRGGGRTQVHPLERPEWGRPSAFGSAAVAERAQRRVRARAEQ